MLTDALETFGEDPSRTAVIDDARQWTWDEFMAEVDRVAVKLADEHRAGPVRILERSGTKFLTAFLAAAKLGRPACTFHSDWAGPELEAASAAVEGYEPEVQPPDDDPVFYIGFTSGTSGQPKPFARRERSWASSFTPAGELFGVESGDRVLLPGSLQHSHFLFGAVFALNRGAAVRLYGEFDPSGLADELKQASRGVLYLVPTMLLSLDKLDAGPFGGIHSVVISGAKMEAHHWEIARRLFPRALVGELYGASELSFVSVNTEGRVEGDPGFVGQPFPGVEIEIRPAGEDPGDGTGVVFVRSPYLFEGYLEGSEINSPTDPDGFMTVGDIGRLTERGLSLAGRASNMVITGGKNVHPEEVEAQLIQHPAVSECVVIGVAHPHWGEKLVAFLVAADARQAPEVEGLRAYLKERIASYKVPKRWFLVEEIPQTRNRKTDRSPDRLFAGASEL